MDVKQIANIINDISTEVLGENAIMTEDLSNIVEVGQTFINAQKVDNYVRSLVDRIGKSIFTNRKYSGKVASVMRDGWEFGAILQKVDCDLPEAQENESWELQDNTSYDPNVFVKPSITQEYFSKKVTFEVQISRAEIQAKGSFKSASEMMSFFAMIENAVETSFTIKLDALVMRTIANAIGETIHADFGASALNSKSGIKAVNLLYLYNEAFPTALLTADEAIYSPDFIRFANNVMTQYVARLSTASTLFNIEGRVRFTPKDKLHYVVLAEYDANVKSYLQSDSYNAELVGIPNHEVVPFWQGSGLDYGFGNTSKIDVKTASGDTIATSGVLAVMFDSDAIAVNNMNRRTTTYYNPKAEFYNSWFKMDCQYIESKKENFVVFFIA